MRYSAALTTTEHTELRRHLLRDDKQEDICFALWRPSTGGERRGALVYDLVLPIDGERNVHGNASFEPEYFLRAVSEAKGSDAGLALIHSHPRGFGWQGLSDDDAAAEGNHAAQTQVVTGFPLLGMTMASDGSLSARVWPHEPGHTIHPTWCENVRVVGDRLAITNHPQLRPPPILSPSQVRTVSSWGDAVQADLARLRVGIVGAGSVGAIIAEALARVGVAHIRLIDFDSVKELNLDRLLHATAEDARRHRSKVQTLRAALLKSSTAHNPRVDAIEWSVVEEAGFRAALDCDVLFSCVDRPWPRAALNFAAYAHLIPVVDGGILAMTDGSANLRAADWKAHVSAPGRKCLECLEQYDPGLVSAERDGYLDDPTYIKGLPKDHPLRRNENVFPFSLGAASLEVLQFLSMVVAPSDQADVGAFSYHFVTGQLDREESDCRSSCLYGSVLLSKGDHADITVTGRHPAAERERAARVVSRTRVRTAFDWMLKRIGIRS